MVRFSTICRENNHKFLLDLETMKEYPLNLKTLINIVNNLNEEILSYEKILIDLGEGFEEEIKNQEGLLLGNVPQIGFDTVVSIMKLESENHTKSNQDMLKYAAFDETGNLKKRSD